MYRIFDLSKAFNCVNHNILLNKLSHFGIRGTCLDWFRSYLENRIQFTTLGKYKSSNKIVPNGVPQGSVLGPILYLIYVNDIEFCNISSRIFMFADDTVLVSSHTSPKEASKVLEKDLVTVSNYFGNLGLILNASKTKVMNFSKNWRAISEGTFPKIYLKNVEIEAVPHFKYLGVTIDLSLNFKKHMDICLRNMNRKLFVLRKVRKHMTDRTSLTMFKSMVLPYFEFGNIFLLNCYEGELDKIQKAQNRVLRIILRKDRWYRTSLLYRDARLANWKCRALTAAMKLMFKFKNYFSDSLDGTVGNSPHRTTRQNMGPVFCVDKPNSTRFLKSTAYSLRAEWNTLPSSIRNINDFELFKMTIKRYYKEKWEEENN